VKHQYDILVIGGGHAGLESSLIAAKKGCSVLLITQDPNAIGRMSCNPAIGGLAKGQMVREIDVLGGQMGSLADFSGLQFKVLNQSKGRSVWSPRAQVDKRVYEKTAKKKVSLADRVRVFGGEVVRLEPKKDGFLITLRDDTTFLVKAAIVTCGTFLSGKIHIGERKILAGRMGEERSEGITESLLKLGLMSGRLKTGTPPRLRSSSISWDLTKKVFGDNEPVPFSYKTERFNPPNIPCHTIRTNTESHELIMKNIHLSPMFSGDIDGVGPRYCPSIEDKVHKFSGQDSHLLHLEPEWLNSDQIYLNGFSTSLPEDVQLSVLKKVPGLKKVDFLRPGYAIEYDFFSTLSIKVYPRVKNNPWIIFCWTNKRNIWI
jgi:tRNA uridine 5-carboxymethylaminomethyl modification enzyme